MARPFCNKGNSESAFVTLSFSAPEASRTSFIPGAVVTGKHDDRVSFYLLLSQCSDDFSQAPVNFLNGVTELSGFRFSGKILRCIERLVRKRVGKIQEERLVFRLFNESHGFLCVDTGQSGLVRPDVCFQLCFVAKEGTGLHIIAVGDAQVLVKAMPCRIEFGLPAV